MFLLDTTAMSNQFSRRPDPGLVGWMRSVDEAELYTSVLVVGELRKGVAKAGDTARTREINRWLDAEVIPRWASRILPINLAVAERWGRLAGQAMAAGWIQPVVDGLIAATALEYELRVVTRNRRDFDRSGVVVIDPWTG